MARITVDEISRKEFSFANKGYNQKEVKEETLRKAREDAEAIRVKAETEANERLDGLSDERKSLEAEVAALKKTAADYRAQFEALLQAQQEALDKASGLF